MVTREDNVFKALADESRRRLLDRLRKTGGLTLGELCESHDMSRQAVTKHLRILEAANLVVTQKHGREKRHFLNAVPINDIYTRWIHAFEKDRLMAIDSLRQALAPIPTNPRSVEMTDFIYTTYIKSTPEKVWEAITNPAFTRQYWGHALVSDWKQGSDWEMKRNSDMTVNVVGRVIESVPHSRLVLSWAEADRPADESSVAFDIGFADGVVRLDIAHGSLSDYMADRVTKGWPKVVAGLKSLLETGMPLGDGPDGCTVCEG